jgi:hypothetical protein
MRIIKLCTILKILRILANSCAGDTSKIVLYTIVNRIPNQVIRDTHFLRRLTHSWFNRFILDRIAISEFFGHCRVYLPPEHYRKIVQDLLSAYPDNRNYVNIYSNVHFAGTEYCGTNEKKCTRFLSTSEYQYPNQTTLLWTLALRL